jgi:DNA modification methylase
MKLGDYELGYNTANAGIYTGDARELSKAIPDESVDLIFTDPVYDRIDDYRWLAKTAARVLKPDGKVLAWQATALLADTMRAMSPPLNYVWTMHLQKNEGIRPGKSGICVISQCYWFDKDGTSKTYKKIADWYRHSGNKYSGHHYKWSKPIDCLYKWIRAFAESSAIIFDPFTGGGTVPAVCKQLNRRYLAFEIEPDVADMARERVHQTQPPLFTVDNEQLNLFEED